VTKKIKIESLETGVYAIAELYEKQAAKTCELIWGCLEEPMETEGIQAMWVGPELMFLIPEKNQKDDPSDLPSENATTYPVPGDILFMYLPAYGSRQYYDDIRDKPIWDFFLIYGPDPIMSGHSVTLWAHIIEGLEGLAEECKKIRAEGTKPYRVSRISE